MKVGKAVALASATLSACCAQAALVGHYTCDGASGTVVQDSSGIGNDGTLVNAKLGTWTAGRSGTGLYFDGTVGIGCTRVEIPDSPSLRLVNRMTFMAWVRCDDTTRDAPIFAKEGPNGLLSYWFGVFGLSGNGHWGPLLDADGWQGWDFNGRDQGAFVQGRWTHLAATWDGQNVEYYVNGQWTGHSSWSSVIHESGARLFIGSNSEYTFEGNPTSFHGTVDDVRIYDQALSPQEVAAVVAQGEILAPETETVRLGTIGSGGTLSSWYANDENARRICKFVLPNMSAPIVRVDLGFTTTKAHPDSITFAVKSRMSASGPFRIRQYVQKVGTTGEFVLVADNPVGTGYAVTFGVPTGTLSDYVGADLRMTGRIEVQRVGLSSIAQPCTDFEYARMDVTG
ncbi:MAG: LamG domain-containing protein [Armatimonadetes bacterium]|nr:LamG domain-containing protein [Armatimonadota bacterium]